MKIFSPLALTLLFAACSSPSPRYFGTEANEQIISGVRFNVYRSEDSAQAIRLSGRLPGGIPSIKVAAVLAIEAATGCSVILSSVEGDLEVISALFTCE